MSTLRSSPDILERDQQRVGDRVVTSAALLWATNLLLRALQLVTTAILARILVPADYGIVALAMTIVGFLDILSNIQVGGAVIRMQDLKQDHLDTAFTLNLIRGCLSALVLAIIARPMGIYMNDPRLEGVLYVLALPALLGSIHNPYFLLFARNINFRQDSMRNALGAVTGSLVGIIAAFIFRSYWALVAGSVATSLMTMIFSYWKVPGRPRLCLTRSSELLSYGSWLLLINILDYANNKIDYFLIGKGVGSRPLGAYHVGQQVTTMATGDVVLPLSKALFPAFSILSADLGRLRAGYRQIQSIILAIALPIGFGVSALADNVVFLLVGKGWDLAVPVITFLAPVIALQTMTASIESLALSMNKGRLLFIRTAIFLCVRTALMFAGFYLGGFIGIIYARVISGTLFLFYSLGLAATITQGRMLDPIMASWRSLLSVGVMWCGLAMMPSPDMATLSFYQLAAMLVAKIALGGLLYAGTHLLLWKAAGLPEGAEQRLVTQGRRALTALGTKIRAR